MGASPALQGDDEDDGHGHRPGSDTETGDFGVAAGNDRRPGRDPGMVYVQRDIAVDGSILQIQAKVTEAESWYEVGTLVFEKIAEKAKSEHIHVPLPESWLDVRLVDMLVLECEKFTAESGVCFRNGDGEKFIILPGAFPYSLAIKAAFYPEKFYPEYEIDQYESVHAK